MIHRPRPGTRPAGLIARSSPRSPRSNGRGDRLSRAFVASALAIPSRPRSSPPRGPDPSLAPGSGTGSGAPRRHALAPRRSGPSEATRGVPPR
jgi:hypothetical protein